MVLHCAPAPRSDDALAALLGRLGRLRVLSLERCTEAGDGALAALAGTVSAHPQLHAQLVCLSCCSWHLAPACPGMLEWAGVGLCGTC